MGDVTTFSAIMYIVGTFTAINGLIMIAQVQRVREFNRKCEAIENLLKKIMVRRRP